MSQDVLICVMNSTAVFNDVNVEMQSSESCVKCLNIDAELLSKQSAYNDLSKSYLQIEKHCIYLELTMQPNQEILQKDSLSNNQNALEIPEYFENNVLKAQLQAKDTTIWKEIVENVAQIPIATTIAPGIFKIDLDPLAPRLLKNREAHIDYLKHTQEQADTFQGIVDQAKAKQPLDNALDFALFTEVGYKWKPTGRLFTIVGNSCPLTRITPKTIVHLKETTSNLVEKPKTEIKVYNRRPKRIKSVGSSKKAKIVESKIANNSEPNQLWGSNATDVPSSFSFVNDRLSRLFSGIWTLDAQNI
ncbi:hypothetical protein Tco_1278875 [Tanacetum coccineum]